MIKCNKTKPSLRNSVRSFGAVQAVFLLFASHAYAAPPVAVDDIRTIPVNSSITLNLLANDSDPDGDPLSLIEASQPENGSISVNSDGSVFYVPVAGFSGVDTFSYTIQEQGTEEILTATATVTINVRDSEFRPYSESENSTSLADALSHACDSLRSRSDAELGDNGRALLNRCLELEELAASNPEAVENVLNQLAPEEAMTQMQVSAGSSRSQTRAVTQRISQLRASSSSAVTINGIAMRPSGDHLRGGGASADDYSGLLSRLGLFASFQFENTERDQTSRENGYDSDSNALTVGLDYFLNDRWIVGAAFGYTQNDLTYADDGGDLDTEIGSLIMFGSYMRNRFTLDLQAGYAGLAFDSNRRVAYQIDENTSISQTIGSSTEGSQLLFNSQLQWEWHNGALALYPFGRIDYLESEIDGYGETGSGGMQMILGDQSTKQTTLSTGLQATYAVNNSWGVLVPMVKFTLYNEVDSQRDALYARFAYDPDPSNNYLLRGNADDETYYQLGVGTSAVFKGGLSAFFEYQQLLGYENLSSYQVQAGLRYEL